MAFTCNPCHKRPMASFCSVMFEVGRADSFGRCENCGMTDPCMDCRCETVRDRAIDYNPVFVSEAENDEPGCNDCDGFVYVGQSCPSCGLKGSIPEPVKHRIDRATLRGVETIIAENWKSCPACGKTGSHTHSSRPSAPMVAAASPTGRLPRPDFLDETIDLVVRRRRKMLMTDYNFGNTEMRIIAKLCGLTDADLDNLGAKMIETFPGLKRFANVYVIHGDLHFDVETEPVDSEHEPGNPNCLCFGKACIDGS